MRLSPIAEIVSLHAQNIAGAKSTILRAIRIGELLMEVKATLPHGQFTAWCSANLPFTPRTARNYINVYRHRDRIKTETVSDLTDVYRLLTPKPDPVANAVEKTPLSRAVGSVVTYVERLIRSMPPDADTQDRFAGQLRVLAERIESGVYRLDPADVLSDEEYLAGEICTDATERECGAEVAR